MKLFWILVRWGTAAVLVLCVLGLLALYAASRGCTVRNGGFEDGLKGWSAFRITGKELKIEGAVSESERHSGSRSFHISNQEPRRPHIYGTLSQKVWFVLPYHTYTVRFWVKGKDVKLGACEVATHPRWINPQQVPEGTYDWTEVTFTFDTRHRMFVPLRIISEGEGSVWIDDISISGP